MEKKMEEVQQPGAPSVIRIKRKRDDAPLDSLYLESSKRRATDHTYVFKRLDQERQVSAIFRQEYGDDGIPKIRATQDGEEKRDPYALGLVKDVQSPIRQKTKEEVPARPRRFHLSRTISVGAAAVGKSDVATFVERRVPAQNEATPASASTGTEGREQDSTTNDGQQRAFKRPTARARANQGSGNATPKSPAQVDVSMADKLDQWSQETSQHEARQTVQRTTTAAGLQGVDAMDVDNEADYVYDTYYRQALTLATEIPDQGISIGHLVIDEEHEDLWETYLDGEDSDEKEFETDDEDSNGKFRTTTCISGRDNYPTTTATRMHFWNTAPPHHCIYLASPCRSSDE
jgi:hypothetical protein